MTEVRNDRRQADREPRSWWQRRRQHRGGPTLDRTTIVIGGAVLMLLLGYVVWTLVRTQSGVREAAISWSADGRRLVYASEVFGRTRLFAMDADGRNVTPLETGADADDGSPGWSPDGRHLIFDSNRDGNLEIYIAQPDGTEVRRLTNHAAEDQGPIWAPDGQSVFFLSDRETRGIFGLYRMKIDGTGVSRVSADNNVVSPQVSPDGRHVAYHIGRSVYVLDLTTGQSRPLTAPPDDGAYATWSPDGQRLAFTTWRNGRAQVFTMQADGSAQQLLVDMPGGAAADPRWSPDGSRIGFVHTPGTGTGSGGVPLTMAIYTVDVVSGRLTRLSR